MNIAKTKTVSSRKSNSDVVVAESGVLLDESLSDVGKGVWAKTRDLVSQVGASSISY